MQPATRWVFPLAFDKCVGHAWVGNDCVGDACLKTRAGAGRLAQPNALALLQLLRSDLRRGHHHVALRHFLMLKMSGHQVPETVEHRCQALLQACPVNRRSKIAGDVANWVRMIRPGLA